MYRARLKRDLDRWSAMGLVSEREAQAMLADHDAQASSFSVGSVLLVLSAVLLSASILLIVAANWQEIPRLVKVSVVIAFIWGFHCGGALLIALGRNVLGQSLLVLGAASFGGGMALVGQLYHLSGDELDLLYVWLAAAVMSCIFFRSGVMLGFVAVLCVTTVGVGFDQASFDWTLQTLILPPVLSCVIVMLSFWAGNVRVRHVAGCLLLGWLVWLYAHETDVRIAIAFVAGGFGVFAAVAITKHYHVHIVRLIATYGLALSMIGLALVNIEYGSGLPLAFVSIVSLAISIAALVMKGRDDGVVRAMAYLIFAGETLYLSFETIDSLLDTSSFFLISGLLVALLAFGVSRLEKLLAGKRGLKSEGVDAA
jgi:uncharacterized membrane protein